MLDHEPSELNERTRRALQANPHRQEDPDIHMTEAEPVVSTPSTPIVPGATAPPVAPTTPAAPGAPAVPVDPYALDLGRRMRAIHRLREEGPLLENCMENHTYWTRKLAHMPSDSVEYPTTLERLREVHTTLMKLKQRREEDEAIIRSTNYLVPLLRSPEIRDDLQPATP